MPRTVCDFPLSPWLLVDLFGFNIIKGPNVDLVDVPLLHRAPEAPGGFLVFGLLLTYRRQETILRLFCIFNNLGELGKLAKLVMTSGEGLRRRVCADMATEMEGGREARGNPEYRITLNLK